MQSTSKLDSSATDYTKGNNSFFLHNVLWMWGGPYEWFSFPVLYELE